MTDTLKHIRARIDALDDELLKLISRRAGLAQTVARIKGNAHVYRPEREAQILRRLTAANRGPLPDAAVARVYAEVVSACRAMEAEFRVAFLGPRGTYSEEAVGKHFGGMVQGEPCASFDEVFRAVESGECGYGLVPVENSTEGTIARTLDLLLASPLKICGEVLLPVHQCLMNKSGNPARLTRIYSHSQSLAQCHEWLNRRFPDAERVPVVSNAEAARMAARETRAAAIAGRAAARLYGLKVLARNIEDDPNNTTRFLVIAPHAAGPSGRDKTSIVMSTRNIPGAVHSLLTPLAKNGVSMTKLESRPSRTGLWEYVFFVDLEGHAEEPRLKRTLAALERKAAMLKVLGSYPAAN
jgi:chorismate mutase/prephenate dehydratase